MLLYILFSGENTSQKKRNVSFKTAAQTDFRIRKKKKIKYLLRS